MIFGIPAKTRGCRLRIRPGISPEKAVCKQELLKDFGLKDDPAVAVIGIVSRLSSQKGFDLLAGIAEKLFAYNLRIVLLGTGDPWYHKLFEDLALKYPDKLAIKLDFNAASARLIYAGSDMFLMPSRYEPCGLSQLISMRYGTVPVVRATGGLADTVIDYTIDSGKRLWLCLLQLSIDRASGCYPACPQHLLQPSC